MKISPINYRKCTKNFRKNADLHENINPDYINKLIIA